MRVNQSTYTEDQIFQGIKARDKEVVEFINREYRSTIRLLIYRMGGSPEDAKDIFQDAIIRLIKMSEDPSFRLSSSVKTLLYSICKNQWKYKSRMNHRIVSLNPELHDRMVDPIFAEQNDLGLYEKLFWGNFSRLPKTCRDVLSLHLRNYKNSEIARMLNLSVGYVRKRKSICTRKMIEAIKRTSEYHKLMGLINTSISK